MSGGFFRGTSADQDTRFSNKQAKLLKSQKFAPELEHLVDMTKVSMDVIRPWIANRVTELLGFEDEVLINFIYGLLDGKEVNGKQVQISLTGFMEKNTGKFMKELWTLLLTAQKNASGVPQQFLDAKQEETRKKKEEADRIANEIQKKKDKDSRELEEERLKKMDGGAEAKASKDASEGNSKQILPRASIGRLEDGQEIDKRNGVRARDSRCSPSRSNTRSYSDERRGRSRSMSRSPNARGRSIASYSPRSVSPRGRHSPPGSVSPVGGRASRRTRSPSTPRRRSPYRRRSPSPIRRRRSPSPARRRRSPSPARRRRSPSPARRRRSPSLVRRCRSPLPVRRRRRSPPPVRRRRSPPPVRRRRSPSPLHRRRSPSPFHRHRGSLSPLCRRRSPSPTRSHRSPSPKRRRRSPLDRQMSPSLVRHRRSPLPVRRRQSPSPVRRSTSPSPSPVQQRKSTSPMHRRMSSSPMQQRSSTPVRRRSPSPVRHRSQRSSSTPQREYASPARQRSPAASGRRSTPGSHSPSPLERSSSPVRHGIPLPIRMKSPKHRKRSPMQSPGERMRSSCSLRSLQRESRSQKDSCNRILSPSPSPERSPGRSRLPSGGRSDSEERSPHENASRQPRGQMTRDVSFSPPRKAREQKVNLNSMEMSVERKEKRGIPDTPNRQMSLTACRDSSPDSRQRALYSGEDRKSEEKNRSRSNNVKENNQDSRLDSTYTSVEKMGYDHSGIESDSEENDKLKTGDKEKRKHKRSERREATSDVDYSSDNEKEERREAKRRRKEEKRLRKEKKRQKREDRRRRREERRSEKLRGKNQSDASGLDGEYGKRRETRASGNDEMENEQKRLEIELRNKALESLKAKKRVSH